MKARRHNLGGFYPWLLAVGACLSLYVIYHDAMTWLDTPVPMRNVLDKPLVTQVFDLLHLNGSDSVTRVQMLASIDEPFVRITMRVDMDTTHPITLFCDDWALTAPHLTALDSRVSDSNPAYVLPLPVQNDWWEAEPIREGDQLWKDKSPTGECRRTVVVRSGIASSSIYIATNSFNQNELPDGLSAILQQYWIKPHAILPTQGGDYGGIWKKE